MFVWKKEGHLRAHACLSDYEVETDRPSAVHAHRCCSDCRAQILKRLRAQDVLMY